MHHVRRHLCHQPPTHHTQIRDTINKELLRIHNLTPNQTQHPPPCHIQAYLDDLYLTIPTEHLAMALTIVEKEVYKAKLTLNTSKTEMTTTGTPHPGFQHRYTKTFTIMGLTPTEIKQAAEDEHIPAESNGTPLEDITPHEALLVTQTHALTKLMYMASHEHINTQTALTILRNINNHLPIYRARSHLIPTTITEAWDHNTTITLNSLLKTTLTTTQLTQTRLPLHLGGLGLMEFTNRSAAAYLGSWQSFATKSTHNYTDTTFQHHYPHAANHINDAYQRIKHHLLPPDHPKPTWTRWTTNAHDLSQTTLTKLIYNHIYDQLYLTTTNLHRTILDNMNVPANGAWIYPNPLSTQQLTEIHYTTALRHRLGMQLHTHGAPCQHNHNGTQCAQPLDTHAHHSLTCNTGPYRTQRHDNIKQTLNKWIKQHGYNTQVERHTPDLDTTLPDGTHTKAIMDIVATQDTQVYYIDVTVTSPLTAETVNRDQQPTTKNPIQRREQDKRRKYNHHPNLQPFVLSTYGKLGNDAITLLRRMAPTDSDTRSESLNQIYHDIATTLQHGNAESILASQPTPHPFTHTTHTTHTLPTYLITALVAPNTSTDVRPSPMQDEDHPPPKRAHHYNHDDMPDLEDDPNMD